MERGSSKHGPLHDEEMAHETEAMVRGAAQRPHAEEWRETEPLDGADPAAGRPGIPRQREVEMRSELARLLSRDIFPADRAALGERLTDAGASQDLLDRVSGLPATRVYDSAHAVLEALGISSPETRDD